MTRAPSRLAALAGVVLPAAALAQWGGPARVVVEPAVVEEVETTLSLTGTTLAYRTSPLAAPQEGLVVERRVYFGVSYEEGALLLRLDDTAARAQRDAAAAVVAAAEARHAELVAGARPEERRVAKADLDRATAARVEAEAALGRQRDLFAKSATTRNLLDEAIRAHDVARAEEAAARARHDLMMAGTRREQIAAAAAEVRRAKADLTMAGKALADLTVHAPFAGTADQVLVEVGSWVERGGKITDLVDRSVIDVVVLVPERFVGEVAMGKPARCVFRRLDPPVEITGKVVSMGPMATEGGKAFPIVVRFRNDDGRIRPRMSVDVDVPLGAARPRLLIDKDAVLRAPGTPPRVYVDAGGKAEARTVRLGGAVGARVEVLEGLEAGDRVVTRGNERLQPGQQLATGDAGGETPPGNAP